MAEHDESQDPRVSAGYRALGKENPPQALDEAILAASRRAVGSGPRRAGFSLRRWALPVSVAAVVVLTVSLVVRMQLERPELEALPTFGLEKQARDAKQKPPAASQRDEPALAVPKAKTEGMPSTAERELSTTLVPAAPAPETAAASAPAAPAASTRNELAGAEPKAKADAVPSAAERERPAARAPAAPAPAAAPPARQFVPEPPAPKEAPAESVAAPEKRAVLAPAAPGIAEDRAPQALREDAAAAGRLASRAALEDRALLAPETVGKKEESPREWLERIARLRREGRVKEADDSLAEFRKRYPDYEIPKDLREAVLGEPTR